MSHYIIRLRTSFPKISTVISCIRYERSLTEFQHYGNRFYNRLYNRFYGNQELLCVTQSRPDFEIRMRFMHMAYFKWKGLNSKNLSFPEKLRQSKSRTEKMVLKPSVRCASSAIFCLKKFRSPWPNFKQNPFESF